jgi:uncharacterized membrane protein YhaH (DUF805 family)
MQAITSDPDHALQHTAPRVSPLIPGSPSEDAAQIRPQAQTSVVGWLPALSVIVSLGLLEVAIADTAARRGVGSAELLFWIGLLVIFVPVAWRLLVREATEWERAGLVALLGVGLYLVKVLHSPAGFTFLDEFIHWRTADTILTSHHLYQANPLLPVSPLYPALEIVTSALCSMSGLSIFGAGILLIGLARLIMVLSLYLLYRQISGSPRVAGLGVLLYMGNPNYLYFDAQFAYESLALPFATLVLAAVASRTRAHGDRRLGLTVLIVLGIGMVVTAHHLTSYALAALLVLWSAIALLVRRRDDVYQPARLFWTALLAVVAALTWLVYVASQTLGYLAPDVVDAIQEVIRLILRESTARQLFQSPSTGVVQPLWERLDGFGSVICVLLGMGFGLFLIWRRRGTISTGVAALTIASLAYPVSLGFRFTSAGAEISNRASEFVFLAVALVLAMGVAGLRPPQRLRVPAGAVFLVAAAVIFTGGVIVGWPPWALQPGPYAVGADSRSVDSQSVDAAFWMRQYLGPDNRVATDRINSLIMGSYGRQHVITHLLDGVSVTPLFESTSLGPLQRFTIKQGRIAYVEADLRLSAALPQGGGYFELGPTPAKPIPRADLAKFGSWPGVSRIFDSGSIVIYDLGGLSRGS